MCDENRARYVKKTYLDPAFSGNGTPVVFAANNAFVPIFAACFQSLIDHSSCENLYDVVLLHTDISKENQDILMQMIAGQTNLSLRLFDVSEIVCAYDLKANAHISVETYFRFLIQSILPGYSKVLYLDCDLIVNADVAQLYREDVNDVLLAAAIDPEIAGRVNGADRITRSYLTGQLNMRDPFAYFQAGVLLINEDEMRKAYTLDQWLSFASVPYKFHDQDVLNKYCEGRVRFLDMSWNLITDCEYTRVSEFVSRAPEAVYEAYRKAHDAPRIIHYAGHLKPWHKPTEDLACYFWQALRKTPYYEAVLYGAMRFAAAEYVKEDRRNHSMYWKLRRWVKNILKL